MKDIFEAIERLSAQLSYRLEHIAKKSSLAVHFSGYSVSPRSGVLVRLFSTMIHLPKGYAVNFMPRSQPEPAPDDQSWHIDIRRNDGVTRSSWSSGIRVQKLGGGFALTYEGRQLVGEDIHRMLSDLEKPGLSGMGLSIARLWSMMYGRMPQGFATRLEAIRDVDLLDRIYDGLVNDAGADFVDALLPGGGPAKSAQSSTSEVPAKVAATEPTAELPIASSTANAAAPAVPAAETAPAATNSGETAVPDSASAERAS